MYPYNYHAYVVFWATKRQISSTCNPYNVKQGKRMGMDYIQLYKLMTDQLKQSHYFK